ncbi:hypothetical protein [Clostridium perfringens]|uniref:hypothetical protein n=1 Tax=Clostridium perfringens TaxID=1502 RepID=UPI0024BC0945|nr:hypothetical protein [Clostridium perfringens]MDU1308318.1 hypothetical protein [Clostridium perfringens]MDU3194072.1 hypothetical protein [Clostridium perfringens]
MVLIIDLINYLFIILILILTILSTINHITHIYSNIGFKNEYHFYITFSFFIFYNEAFLNVLTLNLYKKFPDMYSLSFLMIHILLFFLVYFYIILFLVAIKFLALGVRKIKIPKVGMIPVDLIPFEYSFLNNKIYKDTHLLRKVILTSYLISTLIFATIITDYLLNSMPSESKDLPILENSLKNYIQIFLISLIPTIYASLRKNFK